MTGLLVTGFEAFGEFETNPTASLVEGLDGGRAGGVPVRTALLPVSYERAPARLLEAVERLRPDAVVCCGLAARATAVGVERIGVNVKDRGPGDGLPDNDGAAPRDEPVVPGGPDGLFATLPVRAVVEALHACGIPAVASGSAGTYVCNAVLYTLLHHLRGATPPVPAGFLHFPRSTGLAVTDPHAPSMDSDTMRRALGTALETVAAHLPPPS